MSMNVSSYFVLLQLCLPCGARCRSGCKSITFFLTDKLFLKINFFIFLSSLSAFSTLTICFPSLSIGWAKIVSFSVIFQEKNRFFFELLFAFPVCYHLINGQCLKGLLFLFVKDRCAIAGANIELFSGWTMGF